MKRFYLESNERDESMRCQRLVYQSRDVGGPEHCFEVFIEDGGRIYVQDSKTADFGDETQLQWLQRTKPVWEVA